MDRIDKSHGRDRLRFKLDKNSFHVDESWFYVSQTKFKVLLIEDMDVLIAPKVQHKSHISKVMFLSVIGVPQVVEREGKAYNFDGKIGAFPCAEEYFTQRKSKKGPKGAKSVKSDVQGSHYKKK